MRIVRALSVLALLAIGVGAFAFYRVARSYQGFEKPVFLEIPHGTSTGRIADMLAAAGVVRSRWDFLLARFATRGRVLQAGEYEFRHAASALEVFDRIARGDIFYYELVVPEGRNIFDIGAAAEHLGLFPASRFVAAARDPRLIRDVDPKAPTLEGYLFPNTYRLSRRTTPERLCQIMTAKWREEWQTLKTTEDVHGVMVLASLVEKEGKLAEERPLIAAVFHNRLRIGMKLDCDPTTIYAALLENRYTGVIHRSDLDSDHPYNTYRHAGLPPGPIANPGLASIRATLSPAVSDALYFVLRPGDSGAHAFSSNMADHTAAIAKYRRGLHR